MTEPIRQCLIYQKQCCFRLLSLGLLSNGQKWSIVNIWMEGIVVLWLFALQKFAIIVAMTDEELFKLIRKAVREKKTIPPHADTQSFAQRYCELQIAKKKVNYHGRHNKMEALMKNFNKLQTYFNLPELLKSINLSRTNEEDTPSICSRRFEVETKQSVDQKGTRNKHLIEMKSLHFAVENERLKSMMTELQEDNPLRGEMLKNNSIYNTDIILDRLNKDKETCSKNGRLFDLLKMFREDKERFLHREGEVEDSVNRANPQEKKDYNDFLHKVSCYLQIALEMEHKSKWKTIRKRRSAVLGKSLPNFVVLNKVVKPKQVNSMLSHDLSNTHYAVVLKDETNKLRLQNRYNMHPVMEKGQSVFSVNSKQGNNLFQTFHDGQALDKTVGASNKQIRQNFTFRRRNVKQRIIKRLDKFIGDIDEETHSNQKENKYYSDEINRLQNQYRGLYCRYKREALAGDKDIENLKKMTSQIRLGTPIHRGSRDQNKGMVMTQVSKAFSFNQPSYI